MSRGQYVSEITSSKKLEAIQGYVSNLKNLSDYIVVIYKERTRYLYHSASARYLQ